MTAATATAEVTVARRTEDARGRPAVPPVPDLAARRTRGRELGRRLGTLIDDPDTLISTLRRALVELSDGPYRRELARVAPGVTNPIGVRGPLLRALAAGLRPAIRRASSSETLWVADHLSRTDELEMRLMALPFLRRSLPDDPERSWQLVRRFSRRAGDWISVDSLASLVAEGILREPYRWAEIEQLVYAVSPWERRLAASTVATMRSTARGLAARQVLPGRLGSGEVTRGLAVIASLLGDADANVRKALSWALRELVPVDRAQVTAFLTAQAEVAAAERDGNRAWVLRDALTKLDQEAAEGVRVRLAGIRRRRGADSTSPASWIAGRFGRLADSSTMREPPL